MDDSTLGIIGEIAFYVAIVGLLVVFFFKKKKQIRNSAKDISENNPH
jgi:hypothetical protein